MTRGEEPARSNAVLGGTASRRPTFSDVARGFKLFLGRDLESVAVAGDHIVNAPDLWDLVEAIWGSPEARQRRSAEALRDVGSFHDLACPVTDASQQQLDDLYRVTCERWRRRGLGACHKTLTKDEPRFSARSVRWNLERVLACGKTEWEALSRLLHRLGGQIEPNSAVTVLGVEAYRMLGAGQEIASGLVAIELLEEDVGRGLQAEQLAEAQAARRIPFIEGRYSLSPADIFYSVSSLQYAPPPVILDMLRQCLAAVKREGWAIFQVPAHLHGYSFDIATSLPPENWKLWKDIHCVPQADILALLADEGFRIVEVIPDAKASVFGLSYTYVAQRMAAGPELPAEAAVGPYSMDSGVAVEGGSAEEMVQILYRSLLQREADGQGLAHYAGMIREGAFNEQTLTSVLIRSPEYRQSMEARTTFSGCAEITVEGCRFAVPMEMADAERTRPWALPYFLDLCHPGSVLLDLGAGSGLFSLPAARQIEAAGRVYAIEPDAQAFGLLAHNMALSSLDNVELLRIDGAAGIVGDEQGAAPVDPDDRGTGSMFAVDSLRSSLRKIDIVRVSAAAIEDRSAYGALGIIKSDRPGIFLEYAPQAQQARSEGQTLDFLKRCLQFGYSLEIWHRDQPKQRADASQAIAAVKQAWAVRRRRAANPSLDLCLVPHGQHL